MKKPEQVRSHPREAPTPGRTEESATRPLPQQVRRRTVPTGLPLVGSGVLEAVGSNGTVGRAMHDVIHTPDDEMVVTRLGPEQEASVAFRPDHALGDAAAEFAEDFGCDFLMAATTGRDIGEIESAANTDPSELGGPFFQEVVMADDLEDLTDEAERDDD